MVNLSQDDIDVRLQTIQCCIGDLTSKLITSIKIGSSKAHCQLIELQVLQGMIESVECYNVLSDDVTEEDNCLTESQVQTMFDYMASKCSKCFQFPGYSYSTQSDDGQFDDSFSDSFF